jgi:polynucleotide 5'-kinase involved in rRNA processing
VRGEQNLSNTQSRNNAAEEQERQVFRENRERDLKKLFEALRKMNINANDIRIFVGRPAAVAGALNQFANETVLKLTDDEPPSKKNKVVLSNMKFNESLEGEYEYRFESPSSMNLFIKMNAPVEVISKSFDPTTQVWVLRIKLVVPIAQ